MLPVSLRTLRRTVLFLTCGGDSAKARLKQLELLRQLEAHALSCFSKNGMLHDPPYDQQHICEEVHRDKGVFYSYGNMRFSSWGN